MNKIKINLIVTLITLFSLLGYSQNNKGKLDDSARIIISPYIPSQVEHLSSTTQNMLKNKMARLVTKNGMSGNAYNSRFIITPNISILSKDLLATAPPMTALTLDVSFYVGDGVDGKLFASESIEVKGVGVNETKAYIAGIKQIKAKNKAIQNLLSQSKNKIIEYYNTECDFIITQANTLSAQNKFDEAIFTLTSVPTVCKECYDKSMSAVSAIYIQKINRECQMKLQKAQGIWSANQNIAAANAAGAILATVEPSADCYDQVKTLSNQIHTRVKEIDTREWKYILKDQEQRSEWIQAVKAIGVAYGKNQPQNVTYNTLGWW